MSNNPDPEHPDFNIEFDKRRFRASLEGILECIREPKLAREAAEGRFDPEPRKEGQ